jgi:hypothetical protein
LDAAIEEKYSRIQRLQKELDKFLIERPQKDIEIKNQLEEIDKILKSPNAVSGSSYAAYCKEKNSLEKKLSHNAFKEATLLSSMKQPQSIYVYIKDTREKKFELKDFEISNLVRLGLLKEVKDFYTEPQRFKVPHSTDHFNDNYVVVDLNVDSVTDVVVTELGELFINACKEKQEKTNNP